MSAGKVIQGRYRLLSMLGQGGMGSVWRAVHIELGTPVAVKLIDPNVADSKVALGRFKREAQSAASLRGTNVVQILDYGIDDDVPYIVMELLEGESLASRLSRTAPLSPRETSQILMQVGKALARAHALNIVHRDLKPDNIFIVRDGDEDVTKVLDFGIAKTMSTASFEASIQTKSGAILGTPHYMSPEQAAGRSTVDHRSDIWSLGVIGFECLTGCRPFNGSTLGGLVLAICTEPIPKPSEVASVPRGIDEWFERCVNREQSARFQSITDAINTLRVICDPPAFSAPPEPLWETGGREPTLQNSREATMRTPASRDPRWQAAGSAPAETVSAATRTLGSTIKRHSRIAYGSLGILLFVAGVAGVVLFRARIFATSSATAGAAASDQTPLGASAPLVAPGPPESAPALSASPPRPATEQAAISSATLRPSLPVPINAHPQVVPRAPKVSPDPTPASPPSATLSLPTTAPVPVPAAVPSVVPVAAPSEPANRPEPPAADSQTRRRNVEDRLAF